MSALRVLTALGTFMASRKRRLHSADPLDYVLAPAACPCGVCPCGVCPCGARIDPLDQPSANASIAAGTPDIKALRVRMRVSQRQFAGMFGFPVATLRHWERGNRKPTGTALVLLHVIRDNPRLVLREARDREPPLRPRRKRD